MSTVPDARIFTADRLKRLASRARTLAAVYFLVLCTATHIPLEQSQVDVSDKIVHFASYALLTVLVLAGWEFTIGLLEPKHYFAVWLAGTIYGAIDEITQIPVGRHGDVNDWAADVLGIIAGLLLYRVGSAALYRVIAWMEAYDARQ
jgi:VanZ family protein